MPIFTTKQVHVYVLKILNCLDCDPLTKTGAPRGVYSNSLNEIIVEYILGPVFLFGIWRRRDTAIFANLVLPCPESSVLSSNFLLVLPWFPAMLTLKYHLNYLNESINEYTYTKKMNDLITYFYNIITRQQKQPREAGKQQQRWCSIDIP